MLGLTGQARGGRLAAPAVGFSRQNLRIKYIPYVGTNLWITMPAKSTLSYAKSTYVNRNNQCSRVGNTRHTLPIWRIIFISIRRRRIVSNCWASPGRAQSGRAPEFGYDRCVVSHGNPEKMFPSNVLISLEAEKNPLSLIENPHKSPFRNFFYDHSKVELFSFRVATFTGKFFQ